MTLRWTTGLAGFLELTVMTVTLDDATSALCSSNSQAGPARPSRSYRARLKLALTSAGRPRTATLIRGDQTLF